MRRWSVTAVVVALLLLAGAAGASPRPAAAQDGGDARYRIQGHVVDSNGEPVGNLWVGAHTYKDSPGEPDSEQTGPQGSFEIYIPAGVYLLHIQSDMFDACTVSGYENPERRTQAVFDTDDALERAKWAACTFELTPEVVTTELKPGWNLAGWTGAEAEVSALFDAIPQIEAAYAWDTGTQSFLGAVRLESDVRGRFRLSRPAWGCGFTSAGLSR